MKKYLISNLLLAGAFVPLFQTQVFAQPTGPQTIAAELNGTFLGLNSALEYPGYGSTETLEVTIANKNTYDWYPPGTIWTGSLQILPYYITVVIPPGIEFQPSAPAVFPSDWTYTYVTAQTVRLQPTGITGGLAGPPANSIRQFHLPVELTGPVNDQPFTISFSSEGPPYTVSPNPTFSGEITVGGVPLPVSFSDFTVEGDGCSTTLDWTTAMEVNNKVFQIERSANGKAFESIGEVKGAGNSIQPLKYTFVDKDPLNGHNFYRIRQIDFDGKSKYSAIRQVQVNCYEENIRVYPNPTDVVYVSGLQDQTTVEVYDVSGKRVFIKKTQGSTEGLNLSGLAAGTYQVRITKGTDLLLSTPLVIKK